MRGRGACSVNSMLRGHLAACGIGIGQPAALITMTEGASPASRPPRLRGCGGNERDLPPGREGRRARAVPALQGQPRPPELPLPLDGRGRCGASPRVVPPGTPAGRRAVCPGHGGDGIRSPPRPAPPKGLSWRSPDDGYWREHEHPRPSARRRPAAQRLVGLVSHPHSQWWRCCPSRRGRSLGSDLPGQRFPLCLGFRCVVQTSFIRAR